MTLKKILLGTIACSVAVSLYAGDAFATERAKPKPMTATTHKQKADMGAYVAARGGLDMMRHRGHKDTWLASGAVGMYYDVMRAELEYTYHGEVKKSRDAVETKLRTQSYLLNLYYDIPLSKHFKPFISAGAGMSHIRLSAEDEGKETDNKFSWTAGGGMAFDLTKDLALDVGYRYLDLGSSVSSNEFYGGIRFSF